MKDKLLVFGGTAEARELLENGIPAICSVATVYGAKMLDGIKNAKMIVGRLDEERMRELLESEKITFVVDATHPYAREVTKNISEACKKTRIPLMRVVRERVLTDDSVIVAESCREAARLLDGIPGRCFLTTGSNELDRFTEVNDYKNRLYARVLPLSSIIKRCEELGFDAAHIIAMQGPFSREMNKQMMIMTGASVIITKDGGIPGGTESKLEAARDLSVRAILVRRPDESGYSQKEACAWIKRNLDLG